MGYMNKQNNVQHENGYLAQRKSRTNRKRLVAFEFQLKISRFFQMQR